MPNLVRVRGKRNNRRDVKSKRNLVKIGNPIKKPKLYHEKSTLSQMESLPTEILQEIFILCPNFALPIASTILYQKLTSDHVHSSLMMRYFSRAKSMEGSYTKMDPKHSQDMLPESTKDPDHLDHGDLQSSILTASWMDYEFMRRCSWKFQIQNAKKQLDHFLRDYSREEREFQFTLLLRRITNYFNRFETREPHTDADHWSGEYEYTRKDGLIFKWLVNPLEAECSMFILYVDDPSYVPEDPPVLHIASQNSIFQKEQPRAASLGYTIYQFPYVAHSCQLPIKLLRGPWTQDRGDLVKTLIDSRTTVYRDKDKDTSEDRVEVTEDIVTWMIPEKSIIALLYFCSVYVDHEIIESSPSWDDARQGFFLRLTTAHRGPFLSPLNGFGPIKQPPTYLSEVESHVNTDGIKLLPPSKFSWEIIKGPRPKWVGESLMIIRQEHMIASLEMAESTGDREYLTQFFWLTYTAAYRDWSIPDQVQRTVQSKLKVNADGLLNKASVYYKAWLWLKRITALCDLPGNTSPTSTAEFSIAMQEAFRLENEDGAEEERTVSPVE